MMPTREDILILSKLRDAQVVLRGRDLNGDTFRGRLTFFGVLPLLPSWGFVCTIHNTPGTKVELSSLEVEVGDRLLSVPEWLTLT